MKRLLPLALIFCPIFALAVDTPSMSASLSNGLSKTTVSYFGYFSSEVSDIHDGNASIYAYNLIAFNYKLSPRFTASLRPTFTYDSSGLRYGEDMPARTKMADTHVALIDRSPWTMSHDIKTKAVYKLFLPTDPEWQQAGTYAGLGAEFELARDFSNGYSVGYYPKAFILIQKQNSFVYEDSGRSTLKPTQNSQVEQWVRVSKNFGEKINVSQGMGLKDAFYNSSTAVQGQHSQFRLLETTMNFAVNDNVDLSVGLGQSTLLPSASWQLYKDDETSYVVMTSIRM